MRGEEGRREERRGHGRDRRAGRGKHRQREGEERRRNPLNTECEGEAERVSDSLR